MQTYRFTKAFTDWLAVQRPDAAKVLAEHGVTSCLVEASASRYRLTFPGVPARLSSGFEVSFDLDCAVMVFDRDPPGEDPRFGFPTDCGPEPSNLPSSLLYAAARGRGVSPRDADQAFEFLYHSHAPFHAMVDRVVHDTVEYAKEIRLCKRIEAKCLDALKPYVGTTPLSEAQFEELDRVCKRVAAGESVDPRRCRDVSLVRSDPNDPTRLTVVVRPKPLA